MPYPLRGYCYIQGNIFKIFQLEPQLCLSKASHNSRFCWSIIYLLVNIVMRMMIIWWKPTIGSIPRVNQFDVSLSNHFSMIERSATIQLTITFVFTIHSVLPEPAFSDHLFKIHNDNNKLLAKGRVKALI